VTLHDVALQLIFTALNPTLKYLASDCTLCTVEDRTVLKRDVVVLVVPIIRDMGTTSTTTSRLSSICRPHIPYVTHHHKKVNTLRG